jgi:KaiC/GvpD/RAD55 family RecA-like ATPase
MVTLYKTYINGFDRELGGGIPEGHVVLISGSPGTMKSTVAYNILYNNIKKKNVNGAFISLEQSRKSLLFHMSRTGMKEDLGKKLTILDLVRIRKNVKDLKAKNWLDIIKKHLLLLKKQNPYQILVIDSLPVLEIISGVQDRRTELFYFFEWLRDLNVTTFIVCEVSSDPNVLHDEEFLADGIIYLSMEKVGEIDIHRRIRCIKMRGMDHSTNVFTLELKDRTFRVTQTI